MVWKTAFVKEGKNYSGGSVIFELIIISIKTDKINYR